MSVFARYRPAAIGPEACERALSGASTGQGLPCARTPGPSHDLSAAAPLNGDRRYTLSRRVFLCFAATAWAPETRAEDEAARANTFIRDAGTELGRIARLTAGSDARHAALKQFLARVVDLPGLARFCLGRFWHQADEVFRRRYSTLFETVILLNVQNRLGAYREGGSNAVVGAARSAGDGYDVPTSVRSESDMPVNIIWRVSFISGGPRIEDVTAEGISLRVTLRSDFASYLRQNGNDFNALLGAMQRMIAGS